MKEKKNSKVGGIILLVILILLILSITYIKFFVHEQVVNEGEYIENSTDMAIDKALSDIINNFNENEKINEYKKNNIQIKATLSQHSIYVSYTENEETTTYEFSYNNFFLTINITDKDDNIDKFKKIYWIMIYAVQERLKNNENIDSYINSFLDDTREFDGLSKEMKDDIVIYRMNITKKIGDVGTANTSSES